jgi:cell shape-determining protein MreD
MVLVFVLLVLTFALQWSVGQLIDDRPLVEAELLSPLLGTLLWPLVRVLLAPLEQRLLPSSASD